MIVANKNIGGFKKESGLNLQDNTILTIFLRLK